jgi:predicted Zn-dependent protease
LSHDDPDRIAYQIALAQLDLKAGRSTAALDQYQQMLRLYPTNTVLMEGYAHALLNSGRASEARQILDEALRRQGRPDPNLYLLLAQAARGMKREADAHEAMAEHYFLTGQTFEAVEQLRLATRIPGQDFYQASRIEARLQALEALALEEKEQQKAR